MTTIPPSEMPATPPVRSGLATASPSRRALKPQRLTYPRAADGIASSPRRARLAGQRTPGGGRNGSVAPSRGDAPRCGFAIAGGDHRAGRDHRAGGGETRPPRFLIRRRPPSIPANSSRSPSQGTEVAESPQQRAGASPSGYRLQMVIVSGPSTGAVKKARMRLSAGSTEEA